MFKKIAIIGIILAPMLAGCLPVNSTDGQAQRWTYSHLRLYDPPDTNNPGDDILALYGRDSSNGVEIRLDFLDDQPENSHDIYIVLDTLPGKRSSDKDHFPYSDLSWEYLLVQKFNQPPFILTNADQPISNQNIFSYRDPGSGALIINLEDFSPGNDLGGFAFQVFITNHDSLTLVERTGIAFSNGSPPIQRAQLLLTFWNSLPARTPAQTLRRWDGAHTGPYGQRHGLSHLLQSSLEYGIPLALLDLKTPESLAGLEYIGHMDQVRSQEAAGNLLIPESSFGDPNTSRVSLEFSKSWSSNYHLRESQFAFGPFQFASLPPHPVLFADLPDKQHIQIVEDHRLIPLPAPVNPSQVQPGWDQVDRFGLTLDTKKALINAALSGDPSRLVVFGGSLPDTAWGDSSVAPEIFAYLANHPWIHILTPEDLLAFPTHRYDPLPMSCTDLLCSPPIPDILFPGQGSFTQRLAQIRSGLSEQSENPILSQAWLGYFNFTLPAADPGVFTLRSNYMTRLESVLMAARWAEAPTLHTICGNELCILSTENTYCLISKRGARLLLAVSLTTDGYRQWVAPISQLSIGLSDPRDWRFDLGEASDPGEIPGGFSDSPDPFSNCNAEVKPGEIIFDCDGNGVIKTYRLHPENLEVSYLSQKPVITTVPLVSLPVQNLDNSCEGSQFPTITMENSLGSYTSYCDSRSLVKMPEDPDTNYSPGHFLPFPLMILNLESSEGNFLVKFSFK